MKKKTQSWDEIGKAIGAKMENEHAAGKCCSWSFKEHSHGGNAVYGLGLLGALFYYLSTATSLWAGVVGVFKALFWPAFLVFEALKFLSM